jgi:hypothetical protein
MRTVMLAIVLAGCGSHSAVETGAGAAITSVSKAHPQVLEPVAGAQAAVATDVGVGDSSAHAMSLTEVKEELKELKACGTPPVGESDKPGFVADLGTSQTEGELPVITERLNELGVKLGMTIYGISGYRTPAHSVAVGGYADDPHTKGEAEDIGVDSQLRSSAAQISEAQLASVGLYRPFDPSDDPNNTEVNHVQLIPAGFGPLSLQLSATSAFDQETC